jgi:L-iditol 2-dehydrogenase
MKALVKVKRGEGHVSIQDVPVPQVEQGEVLIRVRNAGVCGTDVHIYHDRFPTTPPVILGHEFAGAVEATGPTVDSVAVGDRVVSENNPFACGICQSCRRGYPNMCPEKRAMGIHSNGCFAKYVKLPAHLLHRIPSQVSFEEAALMEPLAVAIHAVDDRCGIDAGDLVVIMGPGAIGLLAAQVARAEGAGDVIVVGTSRDAMPRLACAAGLGFEICNIEEDDLAERVRFLSNGDGADVVVEAAGASAAVQQGIDVLRRGGRMAVVGIIGQDQISLGWDRMVSKGLSILFSYSSRYENWEKGLDYLARKSVQAKPLITDRIGLEDWREAFRKLERRESIRAIIEL